MKQTHKNAGGMGWGILTHSLYIFTKKQSLI